MQKLILLSLYSVGIIFYSCVSPRYVYSPAAANIPLFKSKGDSKLSVDYSTGKLRRVEFDKYIKNNGFDIQAAYAVSRHWAITLDAYGRWEKDVYNANRFSYYFDSSSLRYKRVMINASAGYFFPTNSAQTIFMNIYTGIGFGKMNLHDKGRLDSTAYSRFYSSDIIKWHIHPAFTFIPYKKAWLSVGTKFTFLKYSKPGTNYTANELDAAYLHALQNNVRFFFEPSVTLQIPVSRLPWIFINGGFSICISGNEVQTSYSRFLNASVGLTFDFFKYVKRNKKTSPG